MSKSRWARQDMNNYIFFLNIMLFVPNTICKERCAYAVFFTVDAV